MVEEPVYRLALLVLAPVVSQGQVTAEFRGEQDRLLLAGRPGLAGDHSEECDAVLGRQHVEGDPPRALER